MGETVKHISLVLIFACLTLGCASPLLAQPTGPWLPAPQGVNADADPAPDLGATYLNSTAAPTLAINSALPAAGEADSAGAAGGGGQGGAASVGTDNDDQWHFSVSPYLWLPGVHGTVGAFDHNAGFKVSAANLLSHFRLGVLGAGEARRNRIVTTLDFLYFRLGDDKAIPFPPEEGVTYANVTANMVILTPKVGYRLINQEKLKADFLTGFRYWYFGENLSFNPANSLNFSKSQNWVDPLVGGRVITPLSPKTVVTIAGDVGGWGTGSQLEYQVVGLVGYKIKPNLTLQAGYRYLYFDYRRFTEVNPRINVAMSGVVFGATWNLR